MKRERTMWIAAGLLGLVVAVGLAVLASHVARPPVGLSGEPVSAGQQLAPARRGATTATGATRTATTGTTTGPTRTATTGAPTTRTSPQAPRHSDDGGRGGDGASSDDHSGRGRGRGGDGDDD